MLLHKLDTVISTLRLIGNAQEIAILLLKFAFHLKHVVHRLLVHKLLGILLLCVLLYPMAIILLSVVVSSCQRVRVLRNEGGRCVASNRQIIISGLLTLNLINMICFCMDSRTLGTFRFNYWRTIISLLLLRLCLFGSWSLLGVRWLL